MHRTKWILLKIWKPLSWRGWWLRHGNRKQTSKIVFSARYPKVPSLGCSQVENILSLLQIEILFFTWHQWRIHQVCLLQLVRKLICKPGILNKPCTEKHLKALHGSLLHHNVVNFSFTATGNYQNGLKDKEAEHLPVFVTYDETKKKSIRTWIIGQNFSSKK